VGNNEDKKLILIGRFGQSKSHEQNARDFAVRLFLHLR